MEISRTQADIRIRKNFTCNLKQFFVYVHKKESDGTIFYVGKGTKLRWCNIYSRSLHWKNTARKHGVYCDIVATSLTAQEALILEKKLIESYGRQDMGTGSLVNMTAGGEGVVDYVFTEEHRQKLAITSTGRKHTEEFKAMVSRIHTGKVVSEETRKKQSDYRTGRRLSDEQKLKLRGKVNSLSRQVMCVQTGVVYSSVTNAARATGSDGSSITKVCKGKKKTHKGFTWVFVVETISNETVNAV